MKSDVILRQLAGAADYQACFELQLRTWGADFREAVPPSFLKISQYVGGVAAGAFAADGQLLGFVYGLTGVRPPGGGRLLPPVPAAASAAPAFAAAATGADKATGAARAAGAVRVAGAAATAGAAGAAGGAGAAGAAAPLVHWSHMLAVVPEARDLRLGMRLKLYQRDLLAPLGVPDMEWTFDPLEARNANLNLNLLGARVIEHVQDMYGGDMGSQLAEGIGTDRFIVRWRIAGSTGGTAPADGGVRAADGAGRAAATATAFSTAPCVPLAVAGTERLPAAPRVRVEVPARIQELKAAEPERALAWRLATRQAFTWYLAGGYRVAGFYRDADGRCFYALERGAA
jgi:predicted GNAT superfamily acetyltransferase